MRSLVVYLRVGFFLCFLLARQDALGNVCQGFSGRAGGQFLISDKLQTQHRELLTQFSRSARKTIGQNGPHIAMAAVALGMVAGLRSTDGKPLNINDEGVSLVVQAQAETFPPLLKRLNGGKLTIIGILMDGIGGDGLTLIGNVPAIVEGGKWHIALFEHYDRAGVRYILLDNPAFRRFSIHTSPENPTIYGVRGADEAEQNRVWSAVNQGIAATVAHIQADIFLPHDSQVAPSVFYLRKRHKTPIIIAKPIVHHQALVGFFPTSETNYELIRRIWSLDHHEMQEYFMQDGQFSMLAPAVRLAEQNELSTALAVSDGNAETINKGQGNAIDFFGRVEGLTIGLRETSRPQHFPFLKKTSDSQMLHRVGINHPEVIAHFRLQGYTFAEAGEKSEQILAGKARAKRALQLNFGMPLEPDKPFFVAFSQLIYVKGMIFVMQNIRHILDKGGQIIVGGPVGDNIGMMERDALWNMKNTLRDEGHPHVDSFVFVDGAISGQLRALMLAGSDFFLLPSRGEAGVLSDSEALYMGSIPVAHNVGGVGKGVNSIIYGPVDPNNQGWELGQAIDRSFSLYKNRIGFKKRQLYAMKEVHSWEGTFEKLIQVYRMETIYQYIKMLDKAQSRGQIPLEGAKFLLDDFLVEVEATDLALLFSQLDRLDRRRRGVMINHVLQRLRL